MNSMEFIEEAFKMFREMLDNTAPLKNMSESIFGLNYDFRKELDSQNLVEIIGKIIRASINSFIILDQFTQHQQIKLMKDNSMHHANFG